MTAIPACMIGIIIGGFMGAIIGASDWPIEQMRRRIKRDRARMRQMSRFLPYHATLGSLFDGIGGFPLVWERVHGAGTAIWASEIDEFCIAVTEKRFPQEV